MSSIEINYRKVRPLDVESLAKKYEQDEEDANHDYNPFNVTQIQSFNPLYADFFVLNDLNYDKVGLNHKYFVEGDKIQQMHPAEAKTKMRRKANATEKANANATVPEKEYHVKSSPLLDPIHYLVGKYTSSQSILQKLPTLSNTEECLPKIANKHNASYVDGFFCYLSSQMLNVRNMLNAIDFYGSYLATQRVFKANVTDDLDYLYQSNYFMERVGKEFSVSCGSLAGGRVGFDDFTGIGSRTNKKRLVLEDELGLEDMDIVTLTDECNPICVEDIHVECDENAEFGDNQPNDNVNTEIVCEYEKPEGDDSSSDEDLNYSSSESEEEDDKPGRLSESEEENNESASSTDDPLEQSDKSSSEASEEEEEQEAYAYINDFPVNLIFLEKCDGTLDRLFMDHQLDLEQGAACLMQIIMSLIAFQKAFHFTHNDLHTNNIMYVNTDVEWLYYKFDNKFYRVPTYGRIFKIIDFGRAIYRFKDRIYCSDSFAPKGDAHTQYNTEPYFNAKKPRIEPNMSFDLCRLGTSIYDFLIQDEEDERDEFQETIYRWCLDDNGKNIMYRRDGEERYPGFKLYKMIAKNVHAHTPQAQLKYPFFEQFLMLPEEAAALDEAEVRTQGLNIDLMEAEFA